MIKKTQISKLKRIAKKPPELLTEADLKYQCTCELDRVGVIWYHIPNAVFRSGKGEKSKAWPDLFIFPPNGQMFFVELKMPGQNLSPDQIQTSINLVKNNYGFYKVTSLEEFRKVMKAEHIDV